MTESDANPDPNTDASANADVNSDLKRETEAATSDAALPEDVPLGVVTIAANRTLDADVAGEAVETPLEDAGTAYDLTTREHVVPRTGSSRSSCA